MRRVRMREERSRSKRVEGDARLAASLILPVPYLLEEVGHVDFLGLHLHHPGMFEHAPWGRSSWAFFLQTTQS